MRGTRFVAAIGVMALSSACALAQYPTAKHTVKKSVNPRAVAVLEWIGEQGKPSASRLIPISIFIDGALQDGGLYMARPAPMTLESGTVYELQAAGKPMGLFDIGSAGHVQTSQFPNSWFGYGVWKPLAKPAPPKAVQLAGMSRAPLVPEADAERPTFARKAEQTGGALPDANPKPTNPATGSQPATKSPSGATTVDSSGNATTAGSNASKTGSGASGSATSGASAPSGSAPAEDPDRPSLKRRSAADSGASTAASEYKPAPDPNRPILHRGVKPGDQAAGFEPDKLKGTPLHLQQMVAVSDATAREPHSFAYTWPDAQQAAAMRKQMEALAQKALSGAGASKPAPEKPAPAHRTTQTGSKRRAVAAQGTEPSGADLQEEKFNAYELSYDAGATLVLTAHTAGSGAALKYVAVAAVVDIYGQPQVVFQSVTDAAHLDQTPWVSLVDVVDVDDSNRADLLFELHGAGQRQFALYRVARAVAQQALVTDPIP